MARLAVMILKPINKFTTNSIYLLKLGFIVAAGPGSVVLRSCQV